MVTTSLFFSSSWLSLSTEPARASLSISGILDVHA